MKQLSLIICSILIYTTAYSQTELWSMTSNGGQYGTGVIYKTDGSGNNQTVQHNFLKIDCTNPAYGKLLQASDGKLYGMTETGGSNNMGTLFQYDPSTGKYFKKIDFNGTAKGSNPLSSLIQASNGKLYGMTSKGGTINWGTLFEFDPSTNTFTKKVDFAGGVASGMFPSGKLMQASNGKLYGMTSKGGTYNLGVIFEFDPATSTFTKKMDFNGTVNGSYPHGALMQASDGKLYGMASYGGSATTKGVLFQYDIATSTYTKKIDFTGTANGRAPYGELIQGTDGKLYGMTQLGGANDKGTLFQFDPITNAYTKKIDFDGTTNGLNPWGSLMQASNGMMYGLTSGGGISGVGVLFEYNPTTSGLNKIMDFSVVPHGSSPRGTLMQASDGMLYGMVWGGGIYTKGVLFQYNISTSTFTKKIDFYDVKKGANPYSSLMHASNGMLYGLTSAGGTNGKGIIFQLDPFTNTYTEKYHFTDTMGNYPTGALLEATNGMFYGMAWLGGKKQKGTLFQFNPVTNTLTRKMYFDSVKGGEPRGSLIQALDGKLYGLTNIGGAHYKGTLFQYDPVSNVYINKFDMDSTNGSYPRSSLVQASDGKLYGTTSNGGTHNKGVLFQFDPVTNIYSKKIDLDSATGSYSVGALIQALDGKLYGTTTYGGVNNKGVLFQFDPLSNLYSKKIDLDSATGSYGYAALLQALNGKLYGVTYMGGTNNKGVLFEYDFATNIYTKKQDFTGANGTNPYYNSLIEVSAPTSVTVNTALFNSLNVYPNPNNGVFTIKGDAEGVYSVVNQLGQTIQQIKLNGNNNYTVDIQNLSAGLYFIMGITNNQIVRQKVIVTK